ncbi:MAG: SIS domain-containing protein, partial [Candidatus Limnocylindrales bacterium]
MPEPSALLSAIFDEHLAVAQRTREALLAQVEELAATLWPSLRGGGKLVVFGNSGSAADAQH